MPAARYMGEALWPESKPYGFDPLNLIQIMLAQGNRQYRRDFVRIPYFFGRQKCRFFYSVFVLVLHEI